MSDDERRARLARRHALHPGHRVSGPVAVTRAMTVLHATEAATVHLAVQARSGATAEQVDAALQDERSLVKQLAMRRTLFVLPRDLVPAVLGSAAARVAGAETRRVAKRVQAAGLAGDGVRWLERAGAAVEELLADGVPRSTREVREQLPVVQARVDVAPGSRWGGEVPVAPWVLTVMGLEGRLVRGPNLGHWRTNRPSWTTMRGWLGGPPGALPASEGYAGLVGRWLRTFGPGTEADLRWWLGSTASAARQALVDLEAVPVSLDGGGTGWVLPEDVEPEPAVEPWAALLPVLDPTTMGWKERDFYLRPAHTPRLFDTNGNAGSTAWWNGRVVGAWVQDPDAVVRTVLCEDPGAEARAALELEAQRLTAWLDGLVITTVYASALMKAEPAGPRHTRRTGPT